MSGQPMPCLWLCGPVGAGKSTVGWEIFRQVSLAGVPAAFVDADQVGLCYPAPPGDRDNIDLKSRNIGAMVPAYRDAGARCLVVSGGMDTADLARRYAERAPGLAITLCRLRVNRAEQRRRILDRGWPAHLADEAEREADAMDREDFVPVCVDTDRLSIADTARLVRARAGGWP